MCELVGFKKIVLSKKNGNQDCTPANPAKVAKLDEHKRNRLAELATLAALQSDFSIKQLEVFAGLPDGWVEFEERVAILEYDGDYSREEAERLAAEELGLSLSFNLKDR